MDTTSISALPTNAPQQGMPPVQTPSNDMQTSYSPNVAPTAPLPTT